jgi:hypothetical protein
MKLHLNIKHFEKFARCTQKACYIHEYPSYKRGGMLCLFLASERNLAPTCKVGGEGYHEPKHLYITRCRKGEVCTLTPLEYKGTYAFYICLGSQ